MWPLNEDSTFNTVYICWRCMANVPVIIHLNRYGKGYHARMLAVLLNKGTVYSSDLLVVPKKSIPILAAPAKCFLLLLDRL